MEKSTGGREGKLDEQRLAGGEDDVDAEAEKEGSAEKRERGTDRKTERVR